MQIVIPNKHTLLANKWPTQSDLSLPSKTTPYKHPLVKVQKPSQEEIRLTKERQNSLNSKYFESQMVDNVYNDKLALKRLSVNTAISFKSSNQLLMSDRFFKKRNKIYQTYAGASSSCMNSPNSTSLMPNTVTRINSHASPMITPR